VQIDDGAAPPSPEPRVGQIISLDEDTLGRCESPTEDVGSDHEDSSMLVKLSSGSDSEGKLVRPVRPAPPKPRPSKALSQQALNRKKSPPGGVGVVDVSPPSSATMSPQTDTVPILRGGVKPAKPPRYVCRAFRGWEAGQSPQVPTDGQVEPPMKPLINGNIKLYKR
jgi:hypothetical protein